MNYPTFEENNISAIAFNRAKKYWNEVKLISMYRDGRHVGEWVPIKVCDRAAEMHYLIAAWRMLGLKPQEKVAVMGQNRPRWATAAGSLFAANLVVVPVYPTLTAEEAAFVLHDSGAKYIVVGTMDQGEKILSVFDTLEDLEKIFVMDPIAAQDDPRIAPYEELISMTEGKVDMEAIYQQIREIQSEDVASIIYTSGTTGIPKGVVLTNGNFLSQRTALSALDLRDTDVFLNHLPFSHSFGLTTDLFTSVEVGATLVISDGIAPKHIRHALQTIRPTVLNSVPRLFEKIYVEVQRVLAEKPAKAQSLFKGALAVGKQVFDLKNEGKAVPLGLALKYGFANRILMKVRKRAGLDRVRIAFAGGAPSSPDLCYFFQSLGVDICQGYGLTETSPLSNVNLPGKNKIGTVGPVIPGVEVKIAEDGEVLIRGGNIMKGYYNRPEETAEAIDSLGWFHTGDIGSLDEEGYLRIVDRKKELIITSGGKNIAPLGIESAFNTEAYIERVVVIGEGRNYLTALLCPNFELLYEWAGKRRIQWASDAELAAHPEVKKLMEERLEAVNQQFARFEQIKKIAIMDHEFSEETGELTPTQKLKRRIVDSKYEKEIEALYAHKE